MPDESGEWRSRGTSGAARRRGCGSAGPAGLAAVAEDAASCGASRLLLGLLFSLLFAASLLAVAVFAAALGDASAGTRVGAAVVGLLVFVAGLLSWAAR